MQRDNQSTVATESEYSINEYAMYAENVHVTYADGTEAVSGVDLRIRTGSFSVFWPNGAGKSTTNESLATLLHPARSSVSVNGFDVADDSQSVSESIATWTKRPASTSRRTRISDLTIVIRRSQTRLVETVVDGHRRTGSVTPNRHTQANPFRETSHQTGMQVICTDGTTFGCAGYELTKYGVKLLGQDTDPEDDRYETDGEPMAYVPHDRLWYIVPDGVQSSVPTGATGAQQVIPQGGVPAQPGPGRPGPQPGSAPGPRR